MALPKIEKRAPSTTLAEAMRAATFCVDLKAKNIVLLNLINVANATDYFLIASGTSDTHVRAIAEHVIDEMKKTGVRVHHVEGLQQGRWVLLDFVDFVVHVFHPVLREFYQLERLWSDAERVPLPEGASV
ncbi:MAG: ribosome silencing factor [Gemmatimonadota bacterium]|nr:ribosome silencing factor [Gemmatimonadota bacterium]